MANRRFEMHQYRHALVRMRLGESNRAISDIRSGEMTADQRNPQLGLNAEDRKADGYAPILNPRQTANKPLAVAADRPAGKAGNSPDFAACSEVPSECWHPRHRFAGSALSIQCFRGVL